MAYAISYCAQLGFWGAFGLTPGQVGISGTELLGRLSVGAAWILLLGGGYVLLMAATLYRVAATRLKSEAAAQLAAAIVTLIVGFFATWGLSGVSIGRASLVALGVAVLWIFLPRLVIPKLLPQTPAPMARPLFSSSVIRGALVMAVVATLAVLANLWMFGLGEHLATGNRRSAAVSAIGVTPPYATVTWTGDVPESYRRFGMTISISCPSQHEPSLLPCDAPFPRQLLYLGSDDDNAIFWDCRAQAAYFVAKGDAHIQLSSARNPGILPQPLSEALGCPEAGTLAKPVVAPPSPNPPSASPSTSSNSPATPTSLASASPRS